MESPDRSYLWSLLLVFCAYGHAATTPAYSQAAIDPGRWYRLANAFLGEDRALEVDSAENNIPYMGRARDSSGQLWHLHPVKGGLYRITNQHLGEGWALGIDPEDPDVPAMAPADGSPRQLWKLTPLADGYWRLTNQGLGKGRSLDTYSDGANAPFMGEMGDYSGQLWKLSPEGFVGASGTATGGGSPSGQVGAAATSSPPVMQATQPNRSAAQAYAQQQLLGKTSAAAQPTDPAAFPPPLRAFSFEPAEQKILPGTSAQKNAGSEDCDGVVHEADQIGNLALVSQFFQNDCYTDGQYNHADYKVERGKLKSSDGGLSVEAYRVYGPARKASEFLASNHLLSFQIATSGDYTLYEFDGSGPVEVARITRPQVVQGGYTDIETVQVSELTSPRVYFLLPSNQLVSAYHQLAPGVQGATLGKYAVATLAKYRYQMQGVPFDTRTGFAYGPATHQNIYGQCRQFFALDLGPQLGVVWQDQKSGAINLTRLNADLKGQATVQVTLKNGMRLAAAATDQKAIYLLLVQDGSQEDQKSKTAILQKADLAGKILMEKAHDSGPSGLNITEFGEDNIASMALSNGNIGMILGRTMHKSEDGLNHQGGIGVVFSAANLTLTGNMGQTSGHSFDSYLTTATAGDFLGIDLGDNYPRGVHLHQFSASEIKSQVVYTFKTAHGEEAANPAGVTFARYAAASVGGKSFYQWSNDNCTYTELGAVVERADGYLVFFIGEPDAQGKSLNNSRLGEALVDARNVGLIKVKKDFSPGEGGGEDADVVPSEIVLSKGPVEEGGFYDFNGGWNAQRNAGVNWLTNYRNPKTENASRLRAVPLSADATLLLWEVWGPEEYHTSYAVRVDTAGRALGQPVDLGREVRINRRDDVLVKNGTAYLVMGNAAGKQLEVVVVTPH